MCQIKLFLCIFVYIQMDLHMHLIIEAYTYLFIRFFSLHIIRTVND